MSETQLQRAVQALRRGQLTKLQRRALAALVVAVAALEPLDHPLATIYGSALDALAPNRPAHTDDLRAPPDGR